MELNLVYDYLLSRIETLRNFQKKNTYIYNYFRFSNLVILKILFVIHPYLSLVIPDYLLI